MEFSSFVDRLRAGGAPKFPASANTAEYAAKLDSEDDLRHLREQFILPTKASLKKKALDGTIPGKSFRSQPMTSDLCPLGEAARSHTNGATNGSANGLKSADGETPGVYFCGNSLGAQPKAVRTYLEAQLETWASIAVGGHFLNLDNSPLVCWQDMAEDCAKKSAGIVGAHASEIVVMNTLTANLHFLMASFYRPTEKRHKIILEWKPFPSDYVSLGIASDSHM
jgi:kynureninase